MALEFGRPGMVMVKDSKLECMSKFGGTINPMLMHGNVVTTSASPVVRPSTNSSDNELSRSNGLH